jgi:hypothetical protein
MNQKSWNVRKKSKYCSLNNLENFRSIVNKNINFRKLNRLKKMFPDYSIDLIKTKFAESDFNAKKCVDILLKEKQIINQEKLKLSDEEKVDKKKRKSNENDGKLK